MIWRSCLLTNINEIWILMGARRNFRCAKVGDNRRNYNRKRMIQIRIQMQTNGQSSKSTICLLIPVFCIESFLSNNSFVYYRFDSFCIGQCICFWWLFIFILNFKRTEHYPLLPLYYTILLPATLGAQPHTCHRPNQSIIFRRWRPRSKLKINQVVLFVTVV